MKINSKHLILALASLPLFGNAQLKADQLDQSLQSGHMTIQEARSDERSGVTIWSEDFAGGWPSGWITIDSSGICPWVYSTDGTWGYFNGNNGTSGTNAIQSNSALNGFLICDVDSANNVVNGQPSGTNYAYLATYFEIPPIDCSNHSSVILEFEQKYRYNNSVSMNVLVSTDSTNWTSFNVSSGLSNNTISPDPDIVTLNLSSIAANQQKVHIRIGWNARVYYWMIDDMVLREGNENDLTNLSGYWEAGAEQLEYYQTPLSQITPLTFKGSYTNNGSNDLPNVSQEISVEFGGNIVHTGASSAISSSIGVIDSVTQNGTFTPSSGIGTYDLTWTVTSSDSTDLNFGDNIISRDLIVTQMIYSRDNGVSTGSISNFSTNSGQTFKIGNIFETFGTTKSCAIDIGISSDASNLNQLFYGELYKWSDLSGSFEFVEATDDHEILNIDLGTIVSLNLMNPVDVIPGELYLVVAGHYGGTSDVRFQQCQGVQERTVYGFNASGSLVYLANPKAPLVRMNMSDVCSINTNENFITQVSVYPNPANEIAYLSFDLDNTANVLVEIIDIKGQIMMVENLGEQSAGSHQSPIIIDQLASGIYTCNITIQDKTVVKKIVVVK